MEYDGVMGKITIYRFTEITDTVLTAEKLEFNVAPSIKGIANGIITGIKITPVEGVADNQGSEQEYGDKQSLGKVEKTYIITGYITERSAVVNNLINTLSSWEEGSKDSLGKFENGRFGYTDEDDNTDDIIPIPNGEINPSGLLWNNIEKNIDFKANLKRFVLKLNFSKGDGT